MCQGGWNLPRGGSVGASRSRVGEEVGKSVQSALGPPWCYLVKILACSFTDKLGPQSY